MILPTHVSFHNESSKDGQAPQGPLPACSPKVVEEVETTSITLRQVKSHREMWDFTRESVRISRGYSLVKCGKLEI